MSNVYDLANELERGIRALPEYQAVATAKLAVDADADASALWSQFVETQQKLQQMLQVGQQPSPEEQVEMTALGQKIEGNTVLKEYFDQQQHLSVYLADIERIVFSPLEDLAK